MQDPITIKDIARALNLSHSTVSRALKDSYQISSKTKTRVLKYAAENNYRPNLSAQNLKGKKSRTIGVVAPTISNSFFGEVISGIEFVAYEKDYTLLITQSFESYDRETNNITQLAWHSVDGLLVSVSSETKSFEHFKKLHNDGLDIVFFDRITDEIETHTVTVDNKEGVYNAVKNLLDRGYKKVAHITSSPELSITKERLEGHLDALAAHHIPFNDQLIKYCDHGGMSYAEVEECLNQLFNKRDKPDAIFTASDRITISTLSYLSKKGIQIPNEVGLSGFSNFSSPELFTPSLTTIRQPAFEMGKKAAELLIDLIEGKRRPKSFEHLVLPTELIVRGSKISVAK
jgi:DNA-binding LacI/PurR family transcriptional regulator